MSIWGIEVGEYSDYRVVGYCTSEESAAARCAIMNGESGRDCYGYFELKNMDATEQVDVWYEVEVYFSVCTREASGWHCHLYDGLYPVIGYKEPQFGFGDKMKSVTVRVRKNDKALAEKVAQDAFYERLAKEEEIEL